MTNSDPQIKTAANMGFVQAGHDLVTSAMCMREQKSRREEYQLAAEQKINFNL